MGCTSGKATEPKVLRRGTPDAQPPEGTPSTATATCPICLETCSPDSGVSWLYECSHCVHRECAHFLLLSKTGRRCPMCRARSRGVDCNGAVLTRSGDELEDDEEEEDEEAEEEEFVPSNDEEESDDAVEGSHLEQQWLLSSCFRAFGRIYGRTEGTRELDWASLRKLVNEDLQGLISRDPEIWDLLPWRLRTDISESLFMKLLNGLEACDNVTRPHFQNVLMLPGNNVVSMPAQPQQVVEQTKADGWLAVARTPSFPL